MYSSLNQFSDKIIQPKGISLELKEHQKTVVHALQEIEDNGRIEINNVDEYMYDKGTYSYLVDTNIGILADKVGSGKTLMIISLIHNSPIPRIRERYYEGSPFISIKQKDNDSTSRTNLILVPHKLVTQWVDFFKVSSALKVCKLSSHKEIVEFDLRELDNLDVLIVGSTKYNDFENKFRMIKWARIIIDEADSIKLPKEIEWRANFVWLVTATPEALRYSSRPYLSKIFKKLQFQIFQNIMVKNDLDYVNKSMKLPIPIRITIPCLTPKEFFLIRQFIPRSIMSMINAGNTSEAIKKLNCNVDTSENILQVITRNISEGIDNKKCELELQKTKLEKYKGNNHIKRKEMVDEIQKIEKGIDRLNIRYDSIKKKIYSLNEEYCPICMDEFSKPVIVNCCQNLFCFECVCMTMNENYTCPCCRAKLRKDDIHIIDNTKKSKRSKKSTKIAEKKDKLDVLKDILKKNPKGKYLIFANFSETFDKIQKELRKMKIKNEVLKGSDKAVNSIIKNFQDGKIPVLMLNAKFFGAGLNLQAATDMIVYHRFKKELEEQVIGRAQRMGRKGPLNIYYLLHDNEQKYFEETDLAEDLAYEDWLEMDNVDDEELDDKALGPDIQKPKNNTKTKCKSKKKEDLDLNKIIEKKLGKSKKINKNGRKK